MQKIREEDWLQTKINGALADYVRASGRFVSGAVGYFLLGWEVCFFLSSICTPLFNLSASRETHAEAPVPTDFTHFLISSTLNLVHFGLRRTG